MTSNNNSATTNSSNSSSQPPPALQAPADRSSRPQVIGDAHAGPSSPFPLYLSGVVQRGFGRGGKELGCPTANLPSRLLKDGVAPHYNHHQQQAQSNGSDANVNPLSQAPTGIYFGWARLISAAQGGRGEEYEDLEQKLKRNEGGGVQEAGGGEEEKKKEVPEQADLKEEECVVLPMVMSLGWNPFYANKTKTAEVHIMHPFSTDFYGLQIRVVVLGYIRPEYNYTSLDALKDDIETDKRVSLNSLLPEKERPAWARYKDDPFFFQDIQRISASSPDAA